MDVPSSTGSTLKKGQKVSGIVQTAVRTVAVTISPAQGFGYQNITAWFGCIVGNAMTSKPYKKPFKMMDCGLSLSRAATWYAWTTLTNQNQS